MKSLTTYVNEKLVISKDIKLYTESPKTKKELREIIEKRLQEDNSVYMNDIDVSEIDDMSYLFYGLDPHNIDISEWDVRNIKNMHGMFLWCKRFNSDLSKWDVSKTKDMDIRHMFKECRSLKNMPDWYKV